MFFKEYLSIEDATFYLHDKINYGTDIDDLADLEREGKIKPALYLQNVSFNDDLFQGKAIISGYFTPHNFILLDRMTYNPYREYPDAYLLIEPKDSFKLELIVESNKDNVELYDIGNIYDATKNTRNAIYPSIKEILPSSVRIKTSELNKLFSTQKPEENYQQHLVELKIELEAAYIEIEMLKRKVATSNNTDMKSVPHQSYRTVDRVMYAMAKLTKLDNSSPYSQNLRSLNTEITTILENDGFPLGSEAVGKWLTRIKEL